MSTVIRALENTVQDLPKNAQGGWLAVPIAPRGPILPAYGTRECDWQLRKFYRHNYNTLVQGAFTGLIKKGTTAPWKIIGGDTLPETRRYVPFASYGAGKFILEKQQKTVEYFQDIVQNAHFGEGWKNFLSRVWLSYLTFNLGAFIEVIGAGNPEGPIVGPVTGIAHLDSLRCYTTGNYEHPVEYYAQSGKVHRLHRTRVIRLVDMPDGEETLYGYGMSALYRAIAVVQREILMGRYIEQSLDDRPKPGLLSLQGMTRGAWETAMAEYRAKQNTDEMDDWGRTVLLFGMDVDHPPNPVPINFATPPEKFDWKTYVEINVNALALALGVDKQEIWELTGGTLGSGQQSVILASKASGKAFGDMLKTIERAMNLYVLPESLEFRFEAKDDQADTAQAQIDQSYMTTASSMITAPNHFKPMEVRQLLANKSETFRDVLTDESGQVTAIDYDIGTLPPVTVTDVPAIPEPIGIPTPGIPQPNPVQALLGQKAYDATRREFVANLMDTIRGGLTDDMNRRRFGIVMRAQLRRLGQMAFEDGLRDGGVQGPLDDDDLVQVQRWLSDQSQYVSGFGNEVYTKGLSTDQIEQRAEMWANKSLQGMYDAGRVSADKNGMYEWVLGRTEEHCPDCLTLNQQRHRFKDWYARDLLPKSDKLACKGFMCDCKLIRTRLPGAGRFLG